MTEKTAWNTFSRYIRLRDCLKTTGSTEYGRCYTCGAVKTFSDLDAGHFVKSTHKDIKFNEDNVHAQCEKCNRFEGGQEGVYALKLIDEIGREKVDWLMSRKHIPKVHDFGLINEKFKNKIKELEV